MVLCLAPEMCSGDEADLVVEAAQTLADSAIVNAIGADGLRVRVNYTFADLQIGTGRSDFGPAQREAMEIFQFCLGALRAWRPDFGVLREEAKRARGYGSFVDELTGASCLGIEPAIDFSGSDHQQRKILLEKIALSARSGGYLRNAFILNGRTARSAADYFMIYEYATMDLGQKSKIASLLPLEADELQRIPDSTCNMSPFDGGRHSNMKHPEKVTLDLAGVQRTTSKLLRHWAEFRSDNLSP